MASSAAIYGNRVRALAASHNVELVTRAGAALSEASLSQGRRALKSVRYFTLPTEYSREALHATLRAASV